MDGLINKVRLKFSNVGQGNTEETSSFRERRIPIQKTQSFKGEKKKSQNWLQRQFFRSMSGDYNSSSRMEHAAAVAAAAYAIKSLEGSHLPDQKKTNGAPEPGPVPFLTRLRSKKEDAAISMPEDERSSEGPQPSLSKLGSKKDDAADTSVGLGPSLTRINSKKEDTGVSITEPGSGSKRFSGENAVISSVSPARETSAAIDEKTPEKTSSPPKKKTITVADELTDTTKFKRTPSKVTDPAPSMKKTTTFGDFLSDGIVPKTDDSPSKPERPASKRDIPPPIKPTTPPPETQSQSSARPEIDGTVTEADAWEKTELAKIKERYEKLNETILSWEDKKKKKARAKLDRTERSLEQRRVKALQKFHSDMESIDQIAGGARAQAEERRRNEELKAKEKANVIRSTGKMPATCFCF